MQASCVFFYDYHSSQSASTYGLRDVADNIANFTMELATAARAVLRSNIGRGNQKG
jgi:hypothetical protein